MATRQDQCGKLVGLYYGKTTKPLCRRKKQHEEAAKNGSRTIFHSAIRKYGAESFNWTVLGNCETLEELSDYEKKVIKISRGCRHPLYNMTEGGDGGGRRGQRMPPLSQETKNKISQSLKEYYKDRPGTMTGMKGNLCPFFGRVHSETTIKKMSIAQKGKDRSYMMGKLNKSAKSVTCTTTGECFELASEAAHKYSIDLSSIIKCCRGKQKTAKGLEFMYSNNTGIFGWTQL